MRFIRNSLFTILLALLLGIGLTQAGNAIYQNGESFLKNSFYSSNFSNLSPVAANTLSNAETAAAISKVSPAVISIYSYKEVDQPAAGQDTWFIPGLNLSVETPKQRRTEISAGTGFFVDSRGYILTNKHVVPEGNTRFTVVFADDKKKRADVVYRDPDKDIAVIKISGEGYPVLDLGDSSKLEIGQAVLSMGNAFGQFENTVSSGSVLALHKTIYASDETAPQKLSNVIQTSARLYPGDSGGPTFNLSGQVVGINVAMALSRKSISFSIPINDAKAAIEAAIGSGG